MKILLTVCGRTGARFFSSTGSIASMKLEAEFDHPEGKLQAHDLKTDKGGEANPVVHEAEVFAGKVSDWLERSRTDHDYEKYIIVADAKFTGQLREKMTKSVLNMVSDFVGKDLQKLTQAELGSHLQGVLTH